jgi:hypothetical protein
LDYKIGIAGPTRVGKTSLIASILADSQNLLAGTPVAMKPLGTPTERRLALHRRELEGFLLANEFNPAALKGTEEPFTYRLHLDPGVPNLGIHLGFQDYPGGWLDSNQRPPGREKDWKECRAWLEDSSVLLVPIDATVLMEATESRHIHALPSILTTPDVADVARNWAKSRKNKREPALMFLCPLKCEIYFSDNGGRQDRADDLAGKVREVYGGILKAVRDESPDVKILYAPVDTIGCVELICTEWAEAPSAAGGFEVHAKYRLRKPVERRVKGAGDVLVALCKHLAEARHDVEKEAADQKKEEAEVSQKFAERDEGFFSNIWYWLNGERNRRRENAKVVAQGAEEVRQRVEEFGKVIQRLADKQYGPRVRDF